MTQFGFVAILGAGLVLLALHQVQQWRKQGRMVARRLIEQNQTERAFLRLHRR